MSSRSTRLFEEICTTAESLSEYLPLFERWLRLFPEESHVELGDSLVKTLFEYISFLVETIIYLRKPSHGKYCIFFVFLASIPGTVGLRVRSVIRVYRL